MCVPNFFFLGIELKTYKTEILLNCHLKTYIITSLMDLILLVNLGHNFGGHVKRRKNNKLVSNFINKNSWYYCLSNKICQPNLNWWLQGTSPLQAESTLQKLPFLAARRRKDFVHLDFNKLQDWGAWTVLEVALP